MADLQAIANEITANPAGLPYLEHTEANAVANADIINNANNANPRTINRDTIPTGAIRGYVTFDAFDGLVTATTTWLQWLTNAGEIPVTADILQRLAGIPFATDSIWAVGDRAEMNETMTELMQYEGSRAKEIDGVIETDFVTPAQMRDSANL